MLTHILLAQAAAAATPAAPFAATAAALYDEVCLKAFPDDAAVDAAMAARGAVPLTPQEVRNTLRDDPGRGWTIHRGDPDAWVMLELPPYHACSVRWTTPDQPVDLSAYRPVADRYVAAHPGFVTLPPREGDIGAIHLHATQQGKVDADGSTDMLIAIDQHSADPAKGGARMLDMRFVHQMKKTSAQ